MKKNKNLILASALVISLLVFNLPAKVSAEDTIIETGDAVSLGNIENEVNTNVTETIPDISEIVVPEPILVPEPEATTTPETIITESIEPSPEPEPIETEVENENEAVVENNAEVSADTGSNSASNNQNSIINTGNAVSEANVVNFINTNITNSSALTILLNKFFGFSGDLDLRRADFTDDNNNESSSQSCCGSCEPCDDPCNSCQDTSVKNENTAVITNNVIVRSSTGGNESNNNEGDALIDTGDAYAAANVVNVVNTNIVNSNYLLLVFNNFGNWAGDLVFPGKDFFSEFFSGGRGLAHGTEVKNENKAKVENNVEANADTGGNEASGNKGDSVIETGNAYSFSNVVNEVNTNLFNEDSFSILFNIQGNWAGNIFGLPPGIFWRQRPGGIEIFNKEPESESESAVQTLPEVVENENEAEIINNIEVIALTGENEVNDNGGDGVIDTGSAYAATNVINIVNTNIIGTNWLLAMINVFGDWDGDITFGRPDLWVGGRAETHQNPAGPGSDISYHFTVFNRGDADATAVKLTDLFDNNYLSFLNSDLAASVLDNEISWDIGNIPAGGSIETAFNAKINDNIPIGQTSINNTVSVASAETDEDTSDNTDTVIVLAYKKNPSPPTPLGLQIPYTVTPILKITKTNNAEGPLTASSTVDYKIVITNEGGSAYHSILTDVIKDKDNNIIHEESWDLDEIFSQEEIIINYTVVFNASTTSGIYTNYAQVKAMGRYPTFDYGWWADSPVATSSVEIIGTEIEEGAVGGAGEVEIITEEKLDEIKSAVQIIKKSFASLLPQALASGSGKLFGSSTLYSSNYKGDSTTPSLYSNLAAAAWMGLGDINPLTLLILFIILCLIILGVLVAKKGKD